MQYQTDLRKLEWLFRHAVKAFEAAFRWDVFLSLKSTASEIKDWSKKKRRRIDSSNLSIMVM